MQLAAVGESLIQESHNLQKSLSVTRVRHVIPHQCLLQ